MIFSHQQATLDSGGINHEVESRIYPGASDYAGLVARYVDTNNHILLQIGPDFDLALYNKVAGAYTPIATPVGASGMASGDLVKLRMVGTTATVWVNGVIKYALPWAAFNVTGTRAGLNSWNSSTGNRFDDVRISSPPLPVTPVNVPFVISEISTSLPSAAPVWVEIPNRLQRASVRRGRNRWTDTVNAGSCVATFKNDDRGLDPEHAGNLLGVNLKPGKRFRIRAIHNAVTYPIFDGFIDSIRQEYNGPRDATAIFTVTDGLGKLNRYPLKSTYAVALDAMMTKPDTWLRLGEASGTVALDSSGNKNHCSYGGVTRQAVAGLIPLDPDKASKFPASPSNWLNILGPILAAKPSWSLSFGLQIPTVTAGTTHALLRDMRLTKGLQINAIGPAGTLEVKVFKEDGTLGASATSFATAAGDSKFITIVAPVGGTIQIWDQFVNVTDIASGIEHTLTNASLIGAADAAYDTTFDEFLVYDSALTSAEIATLWNAREGWSADTASARFTKVLDAAGWLSTARSFVGIFDETLAATGLGVSALAHLRAMAETNEGRLYVTADGTIKMISRSAWITNERGTVRATFGDAAGELPYISLGAYELTYNDVTNSVDRLNENAGLVYRAVDQPSIDAYGPRNEAISSLYFGTGHEDTLAAFRLAHVKDPLSHVDSLSILPGGAPDTLYPAVLARELGQRITVMRRPQNIGAAITMPVIIEGIAHDVTPNKWTTRFSIDAIGALAVADIPA